MRSPQAVSEYAYHLWQMRGCPEGSPETDWLEAERLLAAEGPVLRPVESLPVVSEDT